MMYLWRSLPALPCLPHSASWPLGKHCMQAESPSAPLPADAGFVAAEAHAVADFQKESYQHPGQQNTFRLLMATATVPEGA